MTYTCKATTYKEGRCQCNDGEHPEGEGHKG
jgi:hypothetical protein